MNSDGNIIATSNRYGKGKGILVGGLLSRMFEKKKTGGVSDLYSWILHSSGVVPWASSKGNPDLRFRVLKTGNSWILFCFNIGAQSYSRIRVNIDKRIKFRQASYMKAAPDEISFEEEPEKFVLTMSVEPNEIKVVRLDP